MKVNGKKVTKADAVFGPFTVQRGYEMETVKDGTTGEEKEQIKLDEYGQPVPNFIGFWCQPVWSMQEFDELCPRPVPSETEVVFTKNGNEPDYENNEYIQRLIEWKKRRFGWLTMKSLEPSKLTFEKVKADKPETWVHVTEELQELLGHFEFNELMTLVEEANALDADKLEVNRQTFLSRSKG